LQVLLVRLFPALRVPLDLSHLALAMWRVQPFPALAVLLVRLRQVSLVWQVQRLPVLLQRQALPRMRPQPASANWRQLAQALQQPLALPLRLVTLMIC
jgi:hypothetical protein